MQQIPPARQGRDTRSGPIVTALAERGLVPPDRQDEAVDVVDRVLGAQGAGAAPLRRRFAELAGYVGGAFVVSAAAIFFATQWPSMSEGQRVGLLAVVAVVLAAAGLAVGRMAGGVTAMRRGAEPALRRLAGVLLVGAAGSAAAAVGLQAEQMTDSFEVPPMLGFATLAVLALGGYLFAPTVLGQVAIAFGLFTFVVSTLDALGNVDEIAFGLLVLGIGAAWLVLAERGAWRETGSARVIGCVLMLVGAQIPVFGSDAEWVGYLALLLVAAGSLAMYVGRRAWPYLATGVVGVTLAVPQALMDWTDNSLGPAGVLLAAGVTLLGASLLGLRLRKEVEEPAD